jgi:hypothetical protein
MVSASIGNNPCVRCGKPRIVKREWKEVIQTLNGPSEVAYQTTICPDPECQKLVEERQAREKAKQAEIDLASAERASQRQKRSAKNSK